jgi:hypothetical protein
MQAAALATATVATTASTISSISVGSCFVGSAGLSGTVTFTGSVTVTDPVTFDIWVTDHVPPGKGGDGQWHEIPGSRETITATASPFPFGPLSIVGGQANANSYRVEQSTSPAKSASISPCSSTPPTGSLTITKSVVGAGDWAGGILTFSVTCTDPAFSQTGITINTATGTTATVTGIPLNIDETNSCTVTETGMAAVPAGYTAWVPSYSTDGGVTSVTSTVPGAVTVTNTTTLIPPDQGNFQFSKTIGGNLTGWSGGQFPFTVTCGDNTPVSVTLTVGATGSAVSSQSFGPYDPGTSCSVTEGSLPAAGTYASWVNSPSYSPTSGSATIVSGQTVTVAVTNTRTYSPPIVPRAVPPVVPPVVPVVQTPTPTSSVEAATSMPSPTGSVLSATSKPHVTPPTTATIDSTTGGQPASSVWLVLLALAGLLGSILLLTPVPARARRER